MSFIQFKMNAEAAAIRMHISQFKTPILKKTRLKINNVINAAAAKINMRIFEKSMLKNVVSFLKRKEDS